MTKKINKGLTDKNELLNRLQTGDSKGLDDFEKEAFEGFAELENTALSEQLIKDLDKRIDETYLKETGARPRWIWYSMAAGLLLVVGLSFYLLHDFTKNESALAMAKEEPKNTIAQPQDQLSSEKPVTPPVTETKAPDEKVVSGTTRDADESKPDERLTARAAMPAKVSNETSQLSAGEAQKEPAPGYFEADKTAGPPANAASASQENTYAGAGKKQDRAGNDNLAYGDQKKAEEQQRDDRTEREKDAKPAQSESTAYEGSEKKAEKSTSKNKKRSEAPAAGLSETTMASTASGNTTNAPAETQAFGTKTKETKEETAANNTAHDESLAKGAPAAVGGAGGNSSLRRSAYFKTPAFANHDLYFRKEIEKNESLKKSLLKYNKAFRIDVTIDEKGKVLEAKAGLPSECNDCRKAMENIILQMPSWQPAQLPDGTPVKQTFYFNYKY